MISVVEGFTDDQRPQVAALFWAAFSQKLGLLLGPRDKALRFIAQVINPEFALCAVDAQGRVLGVTGFKTEQGGFVGGTYAELAAIYGYIGAVWRGLFLEFLERDLAADQLLMDGIFVDPEMRGEGVGSMLLDALEAKALGDSYGEMRLDVIDSNPRARALYERRGFEPMETKGMGPLRYIFGFRSATTMVLRVGRKQHS